MLIDICCFFFFNDTATTEIYTLSLHDALPISLDGGVDAALGPWGGGCVSDRRRRVAASGTRRLRPPGTGPARSRRSEEHTSELQSRQYLVCRLLLEKKKKKIYRTTRIHRLSSV